MPAMHNIIAITAFDVFWPFCLSHFLPITENTSPGTAGSIEKAHRKGIQHIEADAIPRIRPIIGFTLVPCAG